MRLKNLPLYLLKLVVKLFRNINSLLATVFIELWGEAPCILLEYMTVVQDYVTLAAYIFTKYFVFVYFHCG
jgi:hypothetical protein